METLVEIEGVNGEWATIAGPNEGDQGIYLTTGVKNAFYDPPVKNVFEEFANAPGSRFLNSRYLRRDFTYAVTVLNDAGSGSWISRDSFWRKMWSYQADTKIHVTTDESGHRYLKARMFQAPEVDMTVDPNGNTLNDTLMTCVSGDPFWYEDEVVYFAKTKTDTRYDPSILGQLLTPNHPTEELHIVVDPSDGRGGLNPTDQDIYIKWTIPGSQDPIPGITIPLINVTVPIPWDTAPVTTWTLPDYSWTDPAQAQRRLTLPGLVIGEDCVVNTDPIREQISSASGSQVWARMNGVRFRYPVPAYTPSADFKINVSGCAPGQLVTLRIPRPWSRPWGLE